MDRLLNHLIDNYPEKLSPVAEGDSISDEINIAADNGIVMFSRRLINFLNNKVKSFEKVGHICQALNSFRTEAVLFGVIEGQKCAADKDHHDLLEFIKSNRNEFEKSIEELNTGEKQNKNFVDYFNMFFESFIIGYEFGSRKTNENLTFTDQNYYNVLLDKLPLIMWKIDLSQPEVRGISPMLHTGAFSKLFEGREWKENILDEDLQYYEELTHVSILNKKPYVIEYRLQLEKDLYNIIEIACPYYDNSEVIGYIGLCYDIDKNSEIVKKFNQYKTLLDNARDIILLLRKDGRIVDANTSALAAYGYDYNELTSMSIYDLRSDNTYTVSDQLSKAFSNGIVFEAMHKRKDGRWFPVEVSSTRVQGENSELLMSIIRDITGRKNSEKELYSLLDELKIKNSMEGKLSLTAKKLLERDNFKEAVEFALKQVGESSGADAAYLIFFEDDSYSISCSYVWDKEKAKIVSNSLLNFDFAQFEWLIGKLASGETVKCDNLDCLSDITASEKEKLCEVGVKAFVDIPMRIQEKLIGMIGIENHVNCREWTQNNIDILETMSELVTMAYDRLKIENKLKDSNKELKDTVEKLNNTQSQLIQQGKLAGIGQLAAGIAHEINNPLGFIISNSEVLSDYMKKLKSIVKDFAEIKGDLLISKETDIKEKAEKLDKKFKDMGIEFILEDLDELLNDSSDGLQRIGKIVKGMRMFSRSEQDNQFEQYDLNTGIQNTLIVTKNEIKYYAEVKENLGEIPMISAVGGQINQVLLNIIINAVHAIKAKQLESLGQIAVTTYCHNNHVYCEIEDNGIGIPEENMDKLFVPFFTTKSSGQGTGLGLPISYDIIVNKHKGELLISSQRGVGTKFTIKLPIHDSNENSIIDIE